MGDSADRSGLAELDERLRMVLPEAYQDSYETVQPISMGSAPLKYAADGTVAWDEMWGSFCDLAMAGGPPHKGTLLEPSPRAGVAAQPDRYQEVVDEISRGITLVTDLPADRSPQPGWVRVDCYGDTMSGWLQRAIVMENVAARVEGRALDVPASPAFRLEKEIKNVITVVAKTCHYYMGHLPRPQQRAITSLFARLAVESPLIEPALSETGERPEADRVLYQSIAERLQNATGLPPSRHRYAGWLGVECPSVRAAVWLMRALVVSNVLSRREDVVLFVPVNPAADPNGTQLLARLTQTHRLALARGVL